MTIVEEIPRLAALARNDRRALRMTVGTVRMTVMAVMSVLRTMLRMVVEVLAWGVVVGAGGFVVTAADGGMKCVAVVIDVECEAAGAFAGWAGMA